MLDDNCEQILGGVPTAEPTGRQLTAYETH